MYGRQGDPIYTQVRLVRYGDKIAKALGFAGAPPQSQQPSTFRLMLQQAVPGP